MSGSEGSPGFVEHDRIRIVEVRGSDARGWLNDLVTGPIEALGPEEATRSLLLTPTGRIRADFTVGDPGDGSTLVLLQDADQPDAVDALLAPYVLSSDVELSDASVRLVVFSVLGVEETPVVSEGIRVLAPSMLGPGFDFLLDRSTAPKVARSLSSSMPAADAESLERWRVESGLALFGTDYEPGALPAEAGLESAIDFTKGCFLGQESVAKVRNLGHPQTTLLALQAQTDVGRGDGVYADTAEVGTITSAVVANCGTILLARVRWDASREALSLGNGTPLEPRSVNGA
jgi:folate-binding protein YgfZ